MVSVPNDAVGRVRCRAGRRPGARAPSPSWPPPCPPATPSGTSWPCAAPPSCPPATRACTKASWRWAATWRRSPTSRPSAPARASSRPDVSLVQVGPRGRAGRAARTRGRARVPARAGRGARGLRGRLPRQRPAAQRRRRRRRRPRPPARAATASTSRSCSCASRTSPHWGYESLEHLHVATLAEAREQRFDVAVATWWETDVLALLVPGRALRLLRAVARGPLLPPGRGRERLRAGSTLDLPLAFITEARWIADTLRELRPDAPVPPRPQRDRQDVFAPPAGGRAERRRPAADPRRGQSDGLVQGRQRGDRRHAARWPSRTS